MPSNISFTINRPYKLLNKPRWMNCQNRTSSVGRLKMPHSPTILPKLFEVHNFFVNLNARPSKRSTQTLIQNYIMKLFGKFLGSWNNKSESHAHIHILTHNLNTYTSCTPVATTHSDQKRGGKNKNPPRGRHEQHVRCGSSNKVHTFAGRLFWLCRAQV